MRKIGLVIITLFICTLSFAWESGWEEGKSVGWLRVGGGYGNTGVTIDRDGNLSMDGDLMVGGSATISLDQVLTGDLYFADGGTISTTNNGDLNLDADGTGKINVNKGLWFQTVGMRIGEGVGINWGISSILYRLHVDSAYDEMRLALGEKNIFMFIPYDYYNSDFSTTSQSNPTVRVYSGNDPTTNSNEYISITHDGTNGVIETGDGNLTIGSGSTSHSLTDDGDLMVSRILEVDGYAYFDNNAVFAGKLTGGFAVGALDLKGATQTNSGIMLLTGTGGNYCLMCEYDDRTIDFGHAVQTNPTLFIQSADGTDTSQWISITHDQTNGVIVTAPVLV